MTWAMWLAGQILSLVQAVQSIFLSYRYGMSRERLKHKQRAAQEAQAANDVHAHIDSLDDAAVSARMRDEWTTK